METAKVQIFFALIVFLIIAIAIQSCLYLVSDNSWLLHVADGLWHGGRYYQDFFETNPPMILYLYLPVVWVSKMGVLSVATWFRIYIFALSFLSLFICYGLLKKIIVEKNIAATLLLGLAFIFWIMPATEFGEREHVMIILAMPYFLLAVLRVQNNFHPHPNPPPFRGRGLNPSPPCGGRLGGGVIGIAAGLGLAIKPYFLLAPLFVEVYLILKTKKLFFWWRSENIAIAIVFVLYLLSIMIFAPEYITKILPLVRSLYFPGLPLTWWQAWIALPVWGWIFLLVCYVLGKNFRMYREFDDVFFWAATGFMLAFVVQRAAWYYHWLPLLSLQTLLLVKIIGVNFYKVTHDRQNSSFNRSYACLAVVVLMGFTGSICFWGIYKNLSEDLSTKNYIKATSQFIQQRVEPYAAVYFFMPFLNAAYPLVDYAHVVSASRFPGLVFLPGLYNKMLMPTTDQARVAQEKQWLIDAVLTDFYQQPPTLVFVDKKIYRGYFSNKRFDYIGFFSSDARFKKMFDGCYKHLTDFNEFMVYQNQCARFPLF